MEPISQIGISAGSAKKIRKRYTRLFQNLKQWLP